VSAIEGPNEAVAGMTRSENRCSGLNRASFLRARTRSASPPGPCSPPYAESRRSRGSWPDVGDLAVDDELGDPIGELDATGGLGVEGRRVGDDRVLGAAEDVRAEIRIRH
jgi:hypothetical protein